MGVRANVENQGSKDLRCDVQETKAYKRRDSRASLADHHLYELTIHEELSHANPYLVNLVV